MTTTVSPSPIVLQPQHDYASKYDGYTEDLNSDEGDGYSDEDDEMGELSDSPSSRTSLSRPITPDHFNNVPKGGRTRSSSSPPINPNEPFSLAHKAERILGLTPGTLAHAKAALENARDEVRRLADSPPPPLLPFDTTVNAGGMRSKLDRAKKAMSVTFPSNGGNHTKTPSVVLGAGGREEEERREKRRRAADGVLYWQKEVAKLEEMEQQNLQTQGRGKKRR